MPHAISAASQSEAASPDGVEDAAIAVVEGRGPLVRRREARA